MAGASASHLAVGKRLLAAFDVLLARRPANEEVEAALNTLHELIVASALAGKDREGEDKAFVKLQTKPEWNATVVLLQWLGKACGPILEATSTTMNHEEALRDASQRTRLDDIVKALTVLQGLLHLHAGSSRGVYARRPNMEMLLSLLSVALDGPALDILALPLLSLLLPAFLDSPYNTRLFESLGGLEMLVKAMKNRQARKEVRMAVVEVVWGWWMGEGGEGEMPGSDGKVGARARSSLALPVSVSAIDLDQLRRRRGSSDDSSGSRTSQGSPRTTASSSRESAKAVRRTVVVRPPEPEVVTASAPAMVQTPSRNRTACVQPRSSTPVERRDPRDVPLPETPAASRHVYAEPSPSPMPDRRPSLDVADPAVRLRAMLESTAKAFVQTTPHHARSAKKRVGGSDIGWGTPTNEAAQAPPKLLFPTPPQAPSPSPIPVAEPPPPSSRGESTPQRILRHKKSASLGSLHFASRPYPTPSSSSGGVTPSPSSARLAASAAPLSRHHRSIASSHDVRASPVLTASPSSTSLLPHRSHRRPNHHRPSLSADTAAAPIPRSATSRLALASFLANDSSATLIAGDENSPARGGTPMRSAAGKALAASLVDDQASSLLPPSTTLRDLANLVSTPSPSPAAEDVRPDARSRSKKRRSVHLGPVIVEEPAHEPVDDHRSRRAEDVKKGKLGLHMSNVDQLVRRFREMGDGLQL